MFLDVALVIVNDAQFKLFRHTFLCLGHKVTKLLSSLDPFTDEIEKDSAFLQTSFENVVDRRNDHCRQK